MQKIFETIGFYPADILLPQDVDLSRWAVVACDQFTSQPEYWRETAWEVGTAPSTLNLVLPEVWLQEGDVDRRIQNINVTMARYLAEEIFDIYENSMVYVERRLSDGKVRHGLVGMVDLEHYDFLPNSQAMIRATEGTVLSRIPPRVKVREQALLELPHVMLLIDDPAGTVIEPLRAEKEAMEPLYDFPLCQGGGHLQGWKLTQMQMEAAARAIAELCTPKTMEERYGMKGAAPMLFAVGDGNHSLATAKQCYEEQKRVTPEDQWASLPARYALVEIVNNHDEALEFEAIHRCVSGADVPALLEAFHEFYPTAFEGEGEGHVIEYVWAGGRGKLTVPEPTLQLEVATLQTFLDAYLAEHEGAVDYIHGDDVAEELGIRPGSISFLLPAMRKNQLFKTVLADGVLPRKTFSMGSARDKRYYMEARIIR